MLAPPLKAALASLALLACLGIARANDLAEFQLPDNSAPFLKIDGPPAKLNWQDSLEFQISEETYQRLSAALRRGNLYLRVYAGTPALLKRSQSRDPFDCVSLSYLERTRVRVSRVRGTPRLLTDARVARYWFDQPRDITVVAVVDQGNLPEPFTRVHYTLVGAYIDSGMAIEAGAKSAAGTMVDMGWKAGVAGEARAVAAKESKSGLPAQAPPPQEKQYRGDLTAYVARSYLDVKDMETKRVDRITLGGAAAEMRDEGIKVGERVFVTVLDTAPPHVTIWRSFYPECIRPKIQAETPPDPGVMLVAEVRRCEELSPQ